MPAVVVEAPEVERLQRHVGDQDLVVISAQLQQRQLLAGSSGCGRGTTTKRWA